MSAYLIYRSIEHFQIINNVHFRSSKMIRKSVLKAVFESYGSAKLYSEKLVSGERTQCCLNKICYDNYRYDIIEVPFLRS